jgi:hypothetical protein
MINLLRLPIADHKSVVIIACTQRSIAGADPGGGS